ncbi:Linear primary-alkylsulfatase [Cladobotryum mycophilum]|uniref:Linear primary-alkylsulfatase n=1 Tax=Cladobotryum mycophilum TaxID=491253 RepID=A0ABR0SWQ1_9HYPO
METVSPTFDNKDFQFAQQGLVAKLKVPVVISKATKEVVWDADAYAFLEDECPETANKSLWRQGQLCSVTAGLYLVIDGIYQVRGLDLANMSIVQIPGTNKVIIIDCLTSNETAARAINLYQEYHVGQFGKEAEIVALFYTHCHADHFGGAQAVVDRAGSDLKVIAPDGFLEHAVSENVYAGPAMARRSIYMYGESLEKSPTGQIGSGLGQALSTGQSSLVAPTQNIKVDGSYFKESLGIEIIVQLTPGTEAPAEMNFYFPDYRAICMAENAIHTLHNIQTLRGAPVRDARLWSRYLDESIALFGDKSDVVFSSHHWPTWNEYSDGDDKDKNLVVTFLAEQHPLEIAEDIVMPPTLSTRSNLRGYYGSISHNVKGVYDKYMGWFDGNPANLWPLKPTHEARELVKCMGGPQNTLKLAQGYYDDGNLRFAATLLNKIIFADPTYGDAKSLLSQVYTKLGYGAENGTWRNIYLTGAKELVGSPAPSVNLMTSESLSALNMDELFDSLAIRVDGPKAFAQKGVTIDFMVEDLPQVGSKGSTGWHLRLSNGALTGHAVQYVQPPNPRDSTVTLTAWITHQNLITLVGSAAIAQPVSIDGLVTSFSGDKAAWKTITDLITLPNLAFTIVTPWSPVQKPLVV